MPLCHTCAFSFEKSRGVGNTVAYFNTTWNCTSTQCSFSISSCTFRHSLAVSHKCFCMDSALLSPTHSFSSESFNYWLDLHLWNYLVWGGGGGVVWICLLWVAISGSETKCIYNSFTNELDVFWMYSKDIRNWISLSSYDESSDIISFIFWHTLTCSDLFLGGEISARQWQRKGAVNPSKVFFGGKMAQSRNISRRKKTLNLPDFNHS